MKELLKWPLLLAAIVVVTRIVLELAGAPDSVNNLASVALLFLVVGPVYFAAKIARSGGAHPYRTLLKTIVVYAVLTRLMVVLTYWLAYMFSWQAARFSLEGGGVVGPGSTAFFAFWFPFAASVGWVIGALVIGGILGSIVLAVRRKQVVGIPA